MKTTISSLLLINALAVSSFVGCADDSRSSSHEEEGDLRLELEVYGAGQIVMVEPEAQVCDADDGLCSFSLPAGSRIRLEVAEEFIEEFSGWYDGCDGIDGCEIQLDQDTVVVADFDPEFRTQRRRWGGDCLEAAKVSGASAMKRIH